MNPVSDSPIGRRSGPPPPGPSGRADPMTTHVPAPTGAPGDTVAELLERSHRLGADPRNTNYAGGNTSAKGTAIDPVTGRPVELLWVKGSGGDLGTLTEAGLAVLRLDRLRALVDVYPGVEREDEMVAAFDYCLHGRGGAAPSIDTAMHGLVDAAARRPPPPRLRDRARDRGRRRGADRASASATGWSGCRGAGPGFQLGLDIAAIQREQPGGDRRASSAGTASPPGATPVGRVRGATRSRSSGPPSAFIAEHGRPEPFGPVVAGLRAAARRRAPGAGRRARSRSSAASPRTDRPQVGHFTDSDVVLDFLARERAPAAGRARHVVPRPLPAHQGPAAGRSTCRRRAPLEDVDRPAARAARGVPRRLRGLLRAARRRRTARRCAAPTRRSCSCPGVGMFSLRRGQADRAGRRRVLRQRDQRHARRRGASRPTRRSPSRRSSASSTGRSRRPSSPRMPKPKPLADRVAFVTGAGSGIGKAIAHRLAAEGACVVVADIDAAQRRGRRRARSAAPDVAVGVAADVTDEDAGRRGLPARPSLAFGGVDLVVNNAGLSISKPLLETTVAATGTSSTTSWPAARSSSRARRPGSMIDQGMGGDIVYIVSKNALFAGPNNVAYGAAKADQAHQVRLLAAELGAVRHPGQRRQPRRRRPRLRDLRQGLGRRPGRGPTASPEDKLGEFYAQRTLLKREVLPEHVAAAVFALTGGDLSPDDRPAHPGRRRRRGRVPAVTGGARRGRRPRRVQRPGRSSAGSARTTLELSEVHRFPNEPVALPDGPPLGRRCGSYREVLDGLRAAAPAADDLAGIGVDSWGVDYGLLDADGALLGDPFHYRDDRTARGVERVHARRPAGPSCTRGPGCSSCRSTRSTSSPPSAARPRSRPRRRCCSSRTSSATG